MKKFLACSLIAMLACGALLAGCGGDKKDEAAAGKTKAAFVYVSSAKDGGYSMAHELGRQYVAKNMPDVETSFMESVPEGADSERVINQLAAHKNVYLPPLFQYSGLLHFHANQKHPLLSSSNYLMRC